MNVINEIQKKVKGNLVYLIALPIIFLIGLAAFYVFKFKNEMQKTIDYINTNPMAQGWKKTIEDKATVSGRTYDEQLRLDAKHLLNVKYAGNPFLKLV